MFEIDTTKYVQNLIAGIDEVGRGPLAGPVVAACVVMPKDQWIDGVNDSKKLSEKKRELLDKKIREKAIAVGIGYVGQDMIDRINIKNATKIAMKMALQNLKTAEGEFLVPEIVLIDAETIDTKIAQESFIKGDERCYPIACASIVAKVFRDALMVQFDECFPHYDFAHNKGYGTKKHREALLKYGVCEIHRKSFLKKILYE